MSTEAGGKAVDRAQAWLYFPCGVIRGALGGLGMEVAVSADTQELPAASFQVRSLAK